MRTDDFDFELPEELIAQTPIKNRDQSRMLVLDKKTGEDTLELLETCSKKFGATLIVVTHDLDIARKSDVVIHIEDGKIVEC